jgi:group I intron endonuclease
MEDLKIGVIYKYTSPSGKVYIGQTINEKSRKYQHKNKTPKSNTYFGNAIKKYGFENFTYEVIIKFNPTSDRIKLKRVLDKLEQRYIKLYKSDIAEFGYNLNKGGNGNLGYKHTKEMKQYLKTIPKTDKQLRNLKSGQCRKDRTISEETKKKMSDVRKNKKGVLQYDLKLNLINTFSSIADAAKSIISDATIKTRSNRISECINGK